MVPVGTHNKSSRTAGTPGVQALLRLIGSAMVVFAAVAGTATLATSAGAETRTLRMYYTHTKESITVTFKKDGKYVKSGLKKLNRFLRDFRRNEPTRMDPKLFDLVWEVYQKSGCRKPIQVISGYRSPRTNAMLRRRGRKVAKHSQHTRGKALDFSLPGVSVDKLRALGLQAHVGGVGYYRGSFVHLDTGRVRHWPRMSRRQLSKVFPKGRTLHVPSDGRRMKGYQVASANLKRGLNFDGSRKGSGASSGGTLLASILSGGDKSDKATTKPAVKKPAPKPESTAVANARRQKGADPFAVEETVAATQQATARQTASVDPDTLTFPRQVAVPSSRPVPPSEVPNTRLALVDPNQGVLEPVSQADLVLAPRIAEQPAVGPRPSVDVPSVDVAAREVVEQNTEQNAQKRQAIGALKQRIRTAMSHQRKVAAVERIAEAQAARTAELAERARAAISVPIPKSKPETSRQAILQASLNPELATRPSPRPSLASPIVAEASNSVAGASDAAPMEAELQLGDLDGHDVKAWAIAESTRVGPIASLRAPEYDRGTQRAVPTQVYSLGFARQRAPLRADRFTGRALTRVAFADVRLTN